MPFSCKGRDISTTTTIAVCFPRRERHQPFLLLLKGLLSQPLVHLPCITHVFMMEEEEARENKEGAVKSTLSLFISRLSISSLTSCLWKLYALSQKGENTLPDTHHPVSLSLHQLFHPFVFSSSFCLLLFLLIHINHHQGWGEMRKQTHNASASHSLSQGTINLQLAFHFFHSSHLPLFLLSWLEICQNTTEDLTVVCVWLLFCFNHLLKQTNHPNEEERKEEQDIMQWAVRHMIITQVERRERKKLLKLPNMRETPKKQPPKEEAFNWITQREHRIGREKENQ